MLIEKPARLSGETLEFQQTRIAGLIRALARAEVGLPTDPALTAEIVDYRRSGADLLALAGEITGRADIRSAATSSDFAAAFSAGVQMLLADDWASASNRLLALSRSMPLPNFHETDVITAEMPALAEVQEDDLPHFSPITLRTLPGQKLRVFESALKVSRQVFSTLGGALVAATSGLAREIIALETALAVEALQAVALTSANSTAAGISESTVCAALDYFDSQHIPPAGVLCGPEDTNSTGSSLVLRRILTQAGVSLPVIHAAGLPAGSAFFVGNPAARPALIRLHEADAMPGAPVPFVGWQRIPRSDSFGYYARHCVGYAPGDSRGLYVVGVA